MIDLRPHRKWLSLAALALAIFAAGSLLIGPAQKRAETAVTATKKELATTQRALSQLHADMETANRLQNEIAPAAVERALAPIDRLRAATIVERRAGEQYLSSLHYSFSPETRVAFDTVGAGRQSFAQSQLSLEADAATDATIYAFIAALQRSLPGRLDLKHLKITRPDAQDSIGAVNLHMVLQAVWLSNGAASPLTEGAP